MKNKIIFLGNEFIEEDSFAKEIGFELKNYGFEIININDSFQLMSVLNKYSPEEIVLIDVVENLKEVKIIEVSDLRENSIVSAHDFDAGYVLKLINKSFKIIGIPMKGNFQKIKKEILNLIKEV